MLRKMTLGEKLRKLLGIGIGAESIYEEFEEALIEGDIGPKIALDVVETLRTEVKAGRLKDRDEFVPALKEIMRGYIKIYEPVPAKTGTSFFLVLGVNGVGKTTTVAKLADYYRREHGITRIVLSAGDTFRAAAIDQLKVHGEKLSLRVIHHEQGADPGAVIFDAIQSALASDTQLILADTAGRLHNKEHLIKELMKIDKIVSGKLPGGEFRKLLVLDATTGQNAYKQAETFKAAVNVDSIVLAKYDSTAKGGIVISISKNLGIPFSFMGVGEKIKDLVRFDKDLYLESLIG